MLLHEAAYFMQQSRNSGVSVWHPFANEEFGASLRGLSHLEVPNCHILVSKINFCNFLIEIRDLNRNFQACKICEFWKGQKVDLIPLNPLSTGPCIQNLSDKNFEMDDKVLSTDVTPPLTDKSNPLPLKNAMDWEK